MTDFGSVMKKILPILLILNLILTACGTLEVTLETQPTFTPAPTASFSGKVAPPPLGMDSTSAQIRQALLESPFRWRTIFMDAQVTEKGADPVRYQVWVDQPTLSVRLLSGPQTGNAGTFRAVDGHSVLSLNIVTGESTLAPFTDAGDSAFPFTPVPLPKQFSGVVDSHPLSNAVDPSMAQMIFPCNAAQNDGTFAPVALEVIAYRLTLVVDWTYAGNTQPSYRAWVDISTGTFLRLQLFAKEGGSDVLEEILVTRVDYDLNFPAAFFQPTLSALPNFVKQPLALAAADVNVAEAGAADALGYVYAFVTDPAIPERLPRLVRFPASCAVGAKDCPQAEAILPEEIQQFGSAPQMVWSPMRDEVAFSAPTNPEQTVWTLYLFDAINKNWRELVQFERYLDPPMWSRDGTRLAVRVQDGKGGSEIYAMLRDGSELKNLTANNKLPADGRPYVMDSWLGENVVLRSSVPGQTGTIYLLRPDDGFVKPLFDTLLTKSPFVESPDGTLLATVDYDYSSSKQAIKILTPDGQTLRDLATFAGGSIVNLTWSRDGHALAFVHMTDTAASLYVIDSDGRNLRQAYNSNDTALQFVFSPDGLYLLVQTLDGTGQHLYAVELSTLQYRLVQVPGINLNEAWSYPAWRP